MWFTLYRKAQEDTFLFVTRLWLACYRNALGLNAGPVSLWVSLCFSSEFQVSRSTWNWNLELVRLFLTRILFLFELFVFFGQILWCIEFSLCFNFCIISEQVCVAPTASEAYETRCSLNFGTRARKITNKERLILNVEVRLSLLCSRFIETWILGLLSLLIIVRSSYYCHYVSNPVFLNLVCISQGGLQNTRKKACQKNWMFRWVGLYFILNWQPSVL